MRKIRCNLKDILADRNMSQKELAIQSKTREATISVLCNNEIKRVPKDVIERIAEVLDLIDMNQLFSIENK